MLRLSISVKKNASVLSSSCFSPLYLPKPAGFPSFTVYPFSMSPSTSQYQLYVDSTTTLVIPKLSDCHPAKKNAGGFPNKFLMTPAKQLS